MTATLESLGIDKLPRDVRCRIYEALKANLDQEIDRPPLSEEFRAELRRRAAEDDANPDDTESWEEVQAYIRTRLESR